LCDRLRAGKPYVEFREGIGDALDAGTGYENPSAV
jgi:hypothetical protein